MKVLTIRAHYLDKKRSFRESSLKDLVGKEIIDHLVGVNGDVSNIFIEVIHFVICRLFLLDHHLDLVGCELIVAYCAGVVPSCCLHGCDKGRCLIKRRIKEKGGEGIVDAVACRSHFKGLLIDDPG
jgi:hypothetical protein